MPIDNSWLGPHAGDMSPTEFELIFVVPEVSGPGDLRIEKVEEHLDIVIESHNGLTLATVTAEGSEAVAAALTAATVLAACGLRPVRSYPDLVTRQDIAERAQVTRQAVGNWVRGDRMQSDPFPSPANLAGGGVWLWGDVVAWLQRHDYEIDDIGFPSMDDHARIDCALLAIPGNLRLHGALLGVLGGLRTIKGYVELSGERAAIVYAPSVAEAPHRWAGEIFQSNYALAI